MLSSKVLMLLRKLLTSMDKISMEENLDLTYLKVAQEAVPVEEAASAAAEAASVAAEAASAEIEAASEEVVEASAVAEAASEIEAASVEEEAAAEVAFPTKLKLLIKDTSSHHQTKARSFEILLDDLEVYKQIINLYLIYLRIFHIRKFYFLY